MTKLPVTPYTAKIIIQYAREMREAQRCYFRTKAATYLALSKRYEIKLDKLLASIDETYIFEEPELREWMESILAESLK